MPEAKKEKVFVDGLIVRDRTEKTPDFIIASIAVKVGDFLKWADKYSKNGWVNIDLKKTMKDANKGYGELNSYEKPEAKSTTDNVNVPKFERDSQGKPLGTADDINPEDIPF